MLLVQRIKRFLRSTFVYDVVQFFRLERGYWAWRLLGKGNTPQRVKHKTVQGYAAWFSISTLVESGTYLGEMVAAVERDFRTIYSIELSEELYQRAKSKFGQSDHICLLNGDSAKVLPKVLEQLHLPSLFWLDAHYSGGITAKGGLETPIMQELRLILSHPLAAKHVILIDDARNFNGTNDYPTLQQVETMLSMMCPSSCMSVRNDIIRLHRSDNCPKQL